MGMRSIAAMACAAALLAGCGSGKVSKSKIAGSSSLTTQEQVNAARDAALEAMKLPNRAKAKQAAMRGREISERCLMVAPEEPGCYYWRAVNTGLFYKYHVIGYQTGVKSMISDCKKVISLKPDYDHAGAYRILGELYMRLPQTAGRPDSITRDLDLSEENLRKAVEVSADYPENHIFLAEILLMQGDIDGAGNELTTARDLTPRWKNDASYDDWKRTVVALERKINKAKK
ncbi:MAG: hypothetical protein WC956_03600 [bacterium]